MWAATTDHFATDEEHEIFQKILMEDLNSQERRFNLTARRRGPFAALRGCDAHGCDVGVQVRAEVLTLLATTGRHEEARRWRLCEMYFDTFRQVGPQGAPGMVWISRSDKTHKVRFAGAAAAAVSLTDAARSSSACSPPLCALGILYSALLAQR